MNAKACATSDEVAAWNQIDWQKAVTYVKKLQKRIVKAHLEGRQGKVKSLQWLLTHSFYGRAIAVKSVTENKGNKTAGVDKEIWTTQKQKFESIFKLKRRNYQPSPLKRIYINKKNGKKRPLSIPTMLDRAMQMLYKLALEPLAEITADPNSYGFRPKRCVQDAIEQCFADLGKAKSAKWVLEGDIKGCFDNISHDWILNNIQLDKKILKKWLSSGYIETKRLFATEKGTPQGSPISPTICNMVLDGLERQLLAKFHKTQKQGKAYFPKVNFIRYADDFIVTGETKELLTEGVLPIIREFLQERGMELLIKPSDKNYKAVISKIRRIIKGNPTLKQSSLIRKLNPVIRGWVNFQKYNVSSKIFERLDYDIWKSLWRWCKRRHPNKSHKWIARKYFHQCDNRNWTFSEELENGQSLRLIYATDTKITRFIKTKSDATAYDSKWDDYFAERDDKRMKRDLNGRKKLNYLYKSQKGMCPKCGQRFNIESGYKISHKADKNEILIHKNCSFDTEF